MALLHRATLTPSKAEILAGWLPSQPWAADLPELAPIGGYRFDDPAGEVGMEGILLRSADGAVTVHVPLTYRAAPVEGADAYLLGTLEHSALGRRWVYDATGDPVWIATVTDAILHARSGAEQYYEEDGRKVPVEPKVAVTGSGADAPVPIPELVVVHRLGDAPDGDATLTGRWDGGEGVLIVLRGAA